MTSETNAYSATAYARPTAVRYYSSDRASSIRNLEYTGVAVSTMLFLWLLIWFQLQPARFTEIRAFYLEPESSMDSLVLFQGADAARIAKFDQNEQGKPRPAKKLTLENNAYKAELMQVVERGEDSRPCLIYLSAPSFGHGLDTKIGKHDPKVKDKGEDSELATLLIDLAEKAKRPVLLALDAAQVSSSREFGIYANDPYEGLLEKLESASPPSHPFLVLTSCGTQQQSQMRVKSGGALFAMVLEEALTKISPIERISSKRSNFKELGKRVSLSVYNNTDSHQFPQLIYVGAKKQAPSNDPVIILRSRGTNETEQEISATAKNLLIRKAQQNSVVQNVQQENAKAKANLDKNKPESKSEQTNNEEPSKEDLLSKTRVKLNELWEDLAKSKKSAPYRYDFRTWRNAEHNLVMAERYLLQAKLRAIHSESEAIFKLLVNQLDVATVTLKKTKIPNKEPGLFKPIRLSRNEELSDVGKEKGNELVGWLGLLTDEKAHEIRKKLNFPSAEPPEYDPKQIQSSLIKAFSKFSKSPKDIENIELPEQMLAIWGQAFREGLNTNFAPQLSWNLNRLVDATEVRFDAEAALALTEEWGGQSAIEKLIKDGDVSRRRLEDLAFDPSENDPDNWVQIKSEASGTYEGALKISKSRRDAIMAADKALLEFSYYAPVIIEAQARLEADQQTGTTVNKGENSLFPGKLTGPLKEIQEIQVLLKSLSDSDGSQPGEILKKAEEINNWRVKVPVDVLDPLLLLSVPGIESDDRERAYGKLIYTPIAVPYDESAEASDSKQDSKSDRAQLGRAIGLAELEIKLTVASLPSNLVDKTNLNTLDKLVKELNQNWINQEPIEPSRFFEVEVEIVKLRDSIKKQVTDNPPKNLLAVNPILALPNNVFKTWYEKDVEALSNALKPDFEKLKKLHDERLETDRGEGPLKVLIDNKKTLNDTMPVEVTVEYKVDNSTQNKKKIEIKNNEPKAILLLGKSSYSEKGTNSTANGQPKKTPDPDKPRYKLIDANKASSHKFDLKWDPMVDPKGLNLKSAAFHRGHWEVSEISPLHGPDGDPYEIQFTMSDKHLEDHYKDVGGPGIGKMIQEAFENRHGSEAKRGYVHVGRPFFGAFVVTKKWEGKETLYAQARVITDDKRSNLLPRTAKELKFEKKGDSESFDFTVKGTDISLNPDTTTLELVLSRNMDLSSPIKLMTNSYSIQAIKAYESLQAITANRVNLAKFPGKIVLEAKHDEIIKDLERQKEDTTKIDISLLTVQRKKNDPVVEPLLPGDLIFKVYTGEGSDKKPIKDEAEKDLIKLNKSRWRRGLMWPNDTAEHYIWPSLGSPLPALEWRLEICADDEPRKENGKMMEFKKLNTP